MGVADKYIVRFANAQVNALNFQLCDVDVDGPSITPVQRASAQIIAYFAAQGIESMSNNTSITSVTVVQAGTNLGINVPFPVAQYAAIVAEFPSLPVMTAYGVNIGRSSGTLAPLGTSIVVTERTGSGGPGGRGRHFLPFVSEELVNAQGQVAGTAITNLQANYGRFILDDTGASSLIDILPVLQNAGGSTKIPIVSAQVQPIFSNLASRRR